MSDLEIVSNFFRQILVNEFRNSLESTEDYVDEKKNLQSYDLWNDGVMEGILEGNKEEVVDGMLKGLREELLTVLTK